MSFPRSKLPRSSMLILPITYSLEFSDQPRPIILQVEYCNTTHGRVDLIAMSDKLLRESSVLISK